MTQQQRLLLIAAACLALCGPAPAATRAAPKAAPGFRAADAAYKAYDQRNYAEAIARAREAVAQAPNQRAYRVLLANALAAAGQLGEAEQTLDDAERSLGADAALASAREALRRSQAQASGTAMYRALQANDIPAAISQAQAAVSYAPENPAYRLSLLHALLRGSQWAQADQVATETVALLPDSAVPLALRAYARQRLGRAADARADMDRALQQRGLPAPAVRNLRLVAADIALQAGDGARATAVLEPLPATDADVRARREAASQLAMAPAGTSLPMQLPQIDCTRADAAQSCSIVAGGAPQGPGYQAAAAAYKAMDAKDYRTAVEQARIAATQSPGNRDYQLLYMNAAAAQGALPEAERAAGVALAMKPGDAALLAQRSTLRTQQGNTAGATEDARAAVAAGRDTLPPLELAYLSTRIGDDRQAREAFARADAAGQLRETALLDAGYASIRAQRDQEAVDYLKRAVDAVEALKLKMEPQMLYDTRREIAEVSRKWGVLASVTYRNGAGALPSFGAVSGPTGNRTLQAGVEAYYRPWGFRNGRFVEVFLRGFETLHSEQGGATGGDSFQGALGVRWKPFTQHNAVLSFSRVFGSTNDWLAQAAYSLDLGTDLRVDVPSWWTTRVAAEVGRYTQHPQTYGLASLMVGRSWRLGDADSRNVLFAHGVVTGEYNSTLTDKTSFGAGPGVSLRHWFREDKYNAPRSYVDVTLQYRAHLGGDDRVKGPYFNTLLSY
jgi:hypothetical protein